MLVKNKGYPKGERIFKMEVFLIMKKKFFAVAMATTMALSTAMSASAATVEGAWWTQWTEGYELADGATLEFDVTVKGGDAVWNNVAAVFANAKTTGTKAPADEVGSSYKEYAVVRGDNWGWGGGDNKSVDGSDITYEGGIADEALGGDTGFIAMMKDAKLAVTITRSGNDVTYTYKATGANGSATTRTAKFSANMGDGCYVFFVPDTSTVTVDKKAAGDAGTTAAADTKKGDTATTAAAPADKKDNATTAAAADKKDNKATTKATTKTSPKTGDVAPIAALGAVAVVACAGVVVSRKKVTE